MANKLRVNLMQCRARQASRVICPLGIPLGWGDGLCKALEKINGRGKKIPKGYRRHEKRKILTEKWD